MTQLETDLQSLLQALSTVSDACIASGDYNGNYRVLAAMQQVSAAITLAAAQDIVATLPNDQDATKIKGMLGKMAAAAQSINAAAADVTRAVEIATAFANIVADVNARKIGSALGVIATLAPMLP